MTLIKFELQTQGQRANSTGSLAEDIVANVLERNGILYKRQQRIGRSIYGRPLYADFYLPHHTGALCIECKWQEVSGSADEKYPYLWMNIQKQYPCPAVIVYGGGGAKSGAIQWLKGLVDGESLLAVLSVEAFVTWVGRELWRDADHENS